MKLVNIQEVSSITRCSISTIRRRIADSRKGLSTFPLPIHGGRKKGLWRQDDVLMWNEALPDTPKVPYIESPTVRNLRLINVHNRLLEYGIKIDSGDKGVDAVTGEGDDA